VLSYPPGGSSKGHTHPINRGVFSDITLEPSPGGAVRYAIMPMVFDEEGLLRLDLPVFVRDVSPSDNVAVSLDELDFLRDAQRAIVTTGSVYLSALSMGATPMQIITRVLLPESMPGIVSQLTTVIIALVGESAMAGAIGGGGLGDLAIRYGYQRFRPDIMIATVVILIVLVQFVQFLGNTLAARLDKR